MRVTSEVIERTVRMLQARLPGLLAVYGFGSREEAEAHRAAHIVETPAQLKDLLLSL